MNLELQIGFKSGRLARVLSIPKRDLMNLEPQITAISAGLEEPFNP